MRRLFAPLSALMFLATLAGCQHTCGVCDCDPCNHNCCNTCAGMGYRSACGAYYGPTGPVTTVAPPAVNAEPIQTQPKEKAPETKDKAPEKTGGPEGKGEELPPAK